MHRKLGEAYLVKAAAYNYKFTTAWPSPNLLINTLHCESDFCLLQNLSVGQISSGLLGLFSKPLTYSPYILLIGLSFSVFESHLQLGTPKTPAKILARHK